MKGFKCVVCLLQLILMIAAGASSQLSEKVDTGRNVSPSKLEKEVVSGIYFEDVTPNLLYDTVVPLLFQFPIPKWNKKDVVLSEFLQNCSSPDWSKGSSCPSTFYIPEVQNRFANYILNSQPLVNNFNSNPDSIQDSKIPFECGRILKHFHNLEITSKTLEQYANELQKCSPIEDFNFRKIIPLSFTSGSYMKQVYYKMAEGFRKEVWAKLPSDRIDAGLWANAVSALNALIFSNYYMEANKWKLGLADCQNGRIPSTLLTPDLMADTLQDLFENLNKTGLQAVISAADIGNYYQAPIADCTFTNETFVLRILIPVIQSRSSYSLIKLTSAQFWKDDSEICQIQLSTSSYSSSSAFSSSYVFMDNKSRVAYDTNCKPNELCYVGLGVTTHKEINECASAYFNETDYLNLGNYCQLSCEQISPFSTQETWISQLSSDKFLIGGKENGTNDPDVIVRCPSFPDEFYKPVSQGALELTLPCTCQIYFDSISLSPRAPCYESETTARVFHIVPLHWIKKDKLTGRTVGEHVNFNDTDLILSSTQPLTSNDESEEDSLDYQNQCRNSQKDDNKGHSQLTSGSITDNMEVLVLSLVLVLFIFPMLLFNIFMAFKVKKLTRRINSLIFSNDIQNQLSLAQLKNKEQVEEIEDENLYEEPDFPHYLKKY